MEISEFGNTSGTGAWHIVKLMLLVLIREVNRLFYPSQYLVHVGYHINMCWFIHATALNRGLAVWASFYHRKKLGHMIEMSQDPGLSIFFHLVPIKGFFLLLLIPRVFFGWGGFSLFNMTRHLFFLVIKQLLNSLLYRNKTNEAWFLAFSSSSIMHGYTHGEIINIKNLQRKTQKQLKTFFGVHCTELVLITLTTPHSGILPLYDIPAAFSVQLY